MTNFIFVWISTLHKQKAYLMCLYCKYNQFQCSGRKNTWITYQSIKKSDNNSTRLTNIPFSVMCMSEKLCFWIKSNEWLFLVFFRGAGVVGEGRTVKFYCSSALEKSGLIWTNNNVWSHAVKCSCVEQSSSSTHKNS